MKLKIGEIYRLSNNFNLDNKEEIDGYKNFIFYTRSKYSESTFRFEKGIHNSKSINVNGSKRCPVIIVSSSPHKAGSEKTPWKDRYDSDNGIVTYYGDCKDGNKSPFSTPGNKVLMDEWQYHGSKEKEMREKATPIVFFERIKKGYLLFHGFGVIEKINLITQKGNNKEFTNLEFEFGILDLSEENSQLDWDWISDRCNKDYSNKDTLKKSPKSWKYWVLNGNDKIEKIRRHVIKSKIISEGKQHTIPGSIEDTILKKIVNHYQDKKLKFELFALQITQFYFMDNDVRLLEGYITKGLEIKE